MENTEQAIRNRLIDGQLPCAAAFAIAESEGISPLEVGQQADHLDIRLARCQLGLFGYGPKAEGRHRRIKPMQEVPAELAAAIRDSLDEGDQLACEDAWRIAEQLGIAKQMVADATEGLGLRIVRCQLGAF
jgi:hypothetical protein